MKKPLVKEKDALVSLNVNPCKQCMPLGVATAAYGLRGCLTIFHGSQGCATYIRRHMATHYNEPIDIASSSLTEQGTVYGGEANLHKGIDNLLKLYKPEVICVANTCLAETIGEDLPAMLQRWREKHPRARVQLVAVPAPGYIGSQFQGHFRFLTALLRTVLPAATAAVDRQPIATSQDVTRSTTSVKNRQLNVICGPASPADIRFIKRLLTAFKIKAVLLPDYSDNLDRPRLAAYDRLPSDGTTLAQVRRMGSAAHTLELASLLAPGDSPAEALQELCGVPYTRLNPPVGLRDIDALLAFLSDFSGQPIPAELRAERGRYLDAMVDSHKYNAEGRAAIFGDPDFCYSTARMCVEQGIVPVVVACGSPCPSLKERLIDEVEEVAERFLVDKWIITDAADFGDIERLALKFKANLLIGSSDGRRIAEAHNLPLVRCTFPIHDHIGGQRVRTYGYEGSLSLIDKLTNALLERKETSFRPAIRAEFYDAVQLEPAAPSIAAAHPAEAAKSVQPLRPCNLPETAAG
ncbi:MAG: hypothetical protein LBR39_07625 [Coriobacteriales bacterium]|jgi:nitrogenase molybdenum-iron protein alpha/beta subunit|nr:hypothetical protein [Coriobacteriales bacterium]